LVRVRFFGGWDFPKNLVKDKDFVKKAYAGGVPMGQDLPKKASKAPTFEEQDHEEQDHEEQDHEDKN